MVLFGEGKGKDKMEIGKEGDLKERQELTSNEE